MTDFSLYTQIQKINGKKGSEILSRVFKQLEELKEDEIEEEYVPYVIKMLSD